MTSAGIPIDAPPYDRAAFAREVTDRVCARWALAYRSMRPPRSVRLEDGRRCRAMYGEQTRAITEMRAAQRARRYEERLAQRLAKHMAIQERRRAQHLARTAKKRALMREARAAVRTSRAA